MFDSINLCLVQQHTPHDRKGKKKKNIQRDRRALRKRGGRKEVLKTGRNKVKDRRGEREEKRDRETKKRLMRQSVEIEK